MPAAYTHDSFGMEVLRILPREEKELILSEANLFHIGLQGPDLFFYYHPLKADPVSELGHAIHREPGLAFLKRMAAAEGKTLPDDRKDPSAGAGDKARSVKAEDKALSAAKRAFIYGNICHFVLDRECHGNIFHWQEVSGVTHAEIEGEMDRSLMLRNGDDPLRTMPARHIRPGRREARILKEFYPELS